MASMEKRTKVTSRKVVQITSTVFLQVKKRACQTRVLFLSIFNSRNPIGIEIKNHFSLVNRLVERNIATKSQNTFMNERIAHTEDKLNKIMELFRDQAKSPSAHDWGHFNNFQRTLRVLKSESDKWGSNHPELIKTVDKECVLIEGELDKIADN